MSKESFNSTGGEYFTVSNGAFVKRVKEPTEASTARTNKQGDTVHEERYRALSGRLTVALLKEGKFGKDWQITLMSEEGAYNIQMRHGSRYVTDFAKKLPNIDLGQPVRIAPYDFEDQQTGKRRSGLTIEQGGVKVQPAFTRESAEQLPAMVQVRVKGQMVWDSTDLDEAVDALIVKYLGGGKLKEMPEEQSNEPKGGEEAPF